MGSVSGVAGFASEVLANYRTSRDELCAALSEINTAEGTGPEVLRNIEILREPDTVAVLTGQQAGLFTGPLYTIYKALSAVKLAERLTADGTNAVPVFWAATEDHDFDEVSETSFVDSSGEIHCSTYRPAGYIENAQVGDIRLDSSIDQRLDELFAALPSSEFSAEIREILTAYWSEGRGFGSAFIATLGQLLGKYGIIFVDPMNAGLKKLASPLFSSAIRSSDQIVRSIVERGRDLSDKGFHAQVLVEQDYFPFFWLDDDGRRLALRKTGDAVYRVKGDTREFSLSDLERIANDEPTRFSPGVMLRPVVQDFLFPTVCYFGGAAEIAYFAQNSAAYEMLGRPVTPILHRQSFTVVEPAQRRALEKLDLDLEQMFGGVDELTLELSSRFVGNGSARLFADAEESINAELDRMDEHVSQIDPTLAEHLAKRRKKIVYHVSALRKKTILAQGRSDKIFQDRINRLFASLLPNGALQERTLNVFSFIDRYGLHFIDWIYDAIDLDDRDHRIIEL